MRKIGKIIIGVISILIITVVVGVMWLSKTESGLRWALSQADMFVTFDQIEGELSDFSFSGLSINAQPNEITIASGQGRWQPWRLINKRLVINQLQVSDVQVDLEPTAPQPYQPWQGLDLPINVQIDLAEIKGLKVQSDDKIIYELETATVEATLSNNLLDIAALEIIAPSNQQSLRGQIDLRARADGVVDLHNDVHLQLADRQIDVSGEIDGVWQKLNVRQSINSEVVAEVELEINDVLSERLNWQGEIKSAATVVAINSQQSVNLGDGRFNTSGEFSPGDGLSTLVISLVGEVNGGNQALSFWNIAADLSYQQDSLTVSNLRLVEQQAERQGELTISGEIIGVNDFIQQTDSDLASANLEGKWQSLGWPFAQQQQALLTDGGFEFKGVPSDFSVLANAEGAYLKKPFNLDIDLNVVNQLAMIKAATIQADQSKVTFSGRTALSEATALSENGAASDQLAIEWEIDSPNVQDLMPQLSGDLMGRGKISGARNNPVLSLNATSDFLQFLDYQISGLAIDLDGTWGDQTKQIKGNGGIKQVTQNGKLLAETISLVIEQEGAQSELNFDAKLLERSQLNLAANLIQTDGGLRVDLNQLQLTDSEYDTWSLESPVTIEQKAADQQSLNAEQSWSWQQACLNSNQQAVCVDANLGVATKTIQGTIDDLALASFNPLLDLYQMSIEGFANGSFSYQIVNDKPNAKIDASLVFSDVNLTLPQNNIKSTRRTNQQPTLPKKVSIPRGKLLINQESDFVADLELDLDNDDRITGQLQVVAPIGSENFSNAALIGSLIVDIDSLSDWPISGNFVSGIEGQLNADINLSGSLSQPNVAMQTRLSRASAQIPQLGIDLSDINIQATSAADRKIVVVGEVTSGDGNLNIDGQLNFARLNEPRFNVNLKGENLTFMQSKEMFVVGDIETQLSFQPKLMALEGTIKIREADLDFAVPDGAVIASKDVVLAGEEQQSGIAQKINLTLDLGDKTAIKAQGLEGFLGGRLTLLQEPGGLLLGRGQIDINQGRYAAYEQDFDIDKGLLLFNNGPIDNPTLDINAQKEVDSVIAGVNVSGTASAPILSLYSTPSMQDQDILSVLVFGRKLDGLGAQDGLTLLRIANSLRGGGESNITAITEKIQDTFGLSELELLVDDGSPTIRAGKQLSSQLYVGYGYGLLDAAQSLILRYKINQAWSIQGDVGADSGADLRYQIQR